jgi:hypothetical protein
MTKDGQMYENAIYNNDTLEIKLIDGVRPSNMRGEPKASTAVNQQLTNNLFNEAINKLVDEQVRKNNELVEKKSIENNLVDYQEDKKKNVGSPELL